MDSKFFNIPFRTCSSDSDFSCKDGEVYGLKPGSLQYWAEELDSPAPLPQIEFGIVREILKGWHSNPDVYPSKTLVASEPSMEYWNKLAAQLLSQFRNEADLQNLFVAPFYVMAAWKTYEGNYLSPTSPILLVPNSSIPLVTTDGDTSSRELVFKIAGAIGRLYYKLKTPETLRDWIGKIESLEIFVSDPLQKYSTYDSLLPSKHISTDNYCESLDLVSGEITKERICIETLSLAWKANLNGHKEIEAIRYYPFGNLPLSDMAPGDKPIWKAIEKDSLINLTPYPANQSFSYEDILNPLFGSGKSEETIIPGKGENVTVVTRPLKLNSGGMLKSVRRVYLRGNFTPSNIKISLYASRDMLKWWCISKRKGGTVIGSSCFSFRFYKLEISGFLSESENLQGFVIELRV